MLVMFHCNHPFLDSITPNLFMVLCSFQPLFRLEKWIHGVMVEFQRMPQQSRWILAVFTPQTSVSNPQMPKTLFSAHVSHHPDSFLFDRLRAYDFFNPGPFLNVCHYWHKGEIMPWMATANCA
eukprot:s1291_g7.t1